MALPHHKETGPSILEHSWVLPVCRNDKAEQTFLKFKTALCWYPVLGAPDFPKEFNVQTDASSKGLGTVLFEGFSREEHLIVFISSKLTAAEKNKTIVERECLAIKWALDSLRYFVLVRKFWLVRGHAPRTWMGQNKHTNSRATMWFLALQEFKFMMEPRPEKQHRNTDYECPTLLRTSQCHVRRGGGICRGCPGLVRI